MLIDSEIPLLIEKKSTSDLYAMIRQVEAPTFFSVTQKFTGKRSLQQVSLNNMSRSVLMSLIYPPSVKYCEAIVSRQRGCFRNEALFIILSLSFAQPLGKVVDYFHGFALLEFQHRGSPLINALVEGTPVFEED